MNNETPDDQGGTQTQAAETFPGEGAVAHAPALATEITEAVNSATADSVTSAEDAAPAESALVVSGASFLEEIYGPATRASRALRARKLNSTSSRKADQPV